jgi:hypothetical protein
VVETVFVDGRPVDRHGDRGRRGNTAIAVAGMDRDRVRPGGAVGVVKTVEIGGDLGLSAPLIVRLVVPDPVIVPTPPVVAKSPVVSLSITVKVSPLAVGDSVRLTPDFPTPTVTAAGAFSTGGTAVMSTVLVMVLDDSVPANSPSGWCPYPNSTHCRWSS